MSLRSKTIVPDPQQSVKQLYEILTIVLYD